MKNYATRYYIIYIKQIHDRLSKMMFIIKSYDLVIYKYLYVCMCICMYICLCVCVCVSVCVCLCVGRYVRTHARMNIWLSQFVG